MGIGIHLQLDNVSGDCAKVNITSLVFQVKRSFFSLYHGMFESRLKSINGCIQPFFNAFNLELL